MDKDILAVLSRHWVHSYEEDTPTEKVFRPSTYKLPPSRGRFSFELKEDGGIIEHSIGSTDKSNNSEGEWNLKIDNSKNLTIKTHSDQLLEIISVTPEKLIVKK